MPDGFINVYKPRGMTSHDVVAVIRRCLPRKTKVGHTGTLDPDAVGVLPICVGRGTRLAEYFKPLPKLYLGEMTLGALTTTQDSSGEILRRAPRAKVNSLTATAVKEAAAGFVGKTEQIPPMVSAVKIKGKKLYELARLGKTVERKPRRIEIYSIDTEQIALPKAILRVSCSGGTYIRTLINDIGAVLGVGAYMSKLERLAVGDFTAAAALPLDTLKAMLKADDYSCVLPLDYGLSYLPVIELCEQSFCDDVLHGRPLKIDKARIAAGTYKVLYNGRLLAIAKLEQGSDLLQMSKVLISAD